MEDFVVTPEGFVYKNIALDEAIHRVSGGRGIVLVNPVTFAEREVFNLSDLILRNEGLHCCLRVGYVQRILRVMFETLEKRNPGQRSEINREFKEEIITNINCYTE